VGKESHLELCSRGKKPPDLPCAPEKGGNGEHSHRRAKKKKKKKRPWREKKGRPPPTTGKAAGQQWGTYFFLGGEPGRQKKKKRVPPWRCTERKKAPFHYGDKARKEGNRSLVPKKKKKIPVPMLCGAAKRKPLKKKGKKPYLVAFGRKGKKSVPCAI